MNRHKRIVKRWIVNASPSCHGVPTCGSSKPSITALRIPIVIFHVSAAFIGSHSHIFVFNRSSTRVQCWVEKANWSQTLCTACGISQRHKRCKYWSGARSTVQEIKATTNGCYIRCSNERNIRISSTISIVSTRCRWGSRKVRIDCISLPIRLLEIR